MSELLYHLDTKVLAEQYKDVSGFTSGDGFCTQMRSVDKRSGILRKAQKEKQKNMWDLNLNRFCMCHKSMGVKIRGDRGRISTYPPAFENRKQ